MAAPPRGRGYAMQSFNNNGSVQPLRRPGEFGLKQRFGATLNNEVSEKKGEDKVTKLCNQIGEMSLTAPAKDLESVEMEVASICDTSENLQNFVDNIVLFALKSKWNAHAIALFCEHYIDVTAEGTKLRTLLLRKLQGLYLERNKTYLVIEKFFMDVTFLCEIFYHVKIDGNCIQVLARPIMDYLGMLIDGGSQKEIEIFYEQFPKCFKNLKANYADGLDDLLIKIRKQLVGESTTVTVRAMLLLVFEMSLTDWQPLNQGAKTLYDTLSKPIVRICE